MKLTFIGDPSGAPNPPVCRIFGYEFPIGEPVSVEDEAIAKKLSRNSHFEVAGEVTPVATSPQPRRRKRVLTPKPETANDDANAE